MRRALPCPIRCRRPIWCTTPISAKSFRRPTYRALLSAQRRERTAFDLAAACAANYEAIEELKISYDTITAETPAAVLYERYRTLQSLNRSLCDSLQRVWGAVYDNKNYAYAYVLDRLGRDDLLAKTEEQLAGVRRRWPPTGDVTMPTN